jgi:arsenite/tail-anchored protein-transporting ATPase
MGNAAEQIRELNARLIWVVGKGGVGKSTCAAAIATLLAEQRKVCLISTDPAGSLSEVITDPLPNLQTRQIDAFAEFERMREQYRSSINDVFANFGLESSAQLDRRVIESLWDFAPPGIDEIIALIEIMEHTTDFDTTVIDSAPTGHFLRLLEMPEIALQWVHALLRLLVKYGAVVHVEKIAQDVLAFAKQLRSLSDDLTNHEATAVFVVTLDEPMVQSETNRLVAALERARVPVAGMIVNRAAAERRERGRIQAPNRLEEIVGSAALRAFIDDWTLN